MIVSLDLILVIIERTKPSVPFRTRQGKAVSPMVLWLKPRKSRSSPELNPDRPVDAMHRRGKHKNRVFNRPRGGFLFKKYLNTGYLYSIFTQATNRKRQIKWLMKKLHPIL